LERKDRHKALVETYKGVLMINPGSPTLPMGLQQLSTGDTLKINQGKAKAYIVQLRWKSLTQHRANSTGPLL
jgi:predicted phosphodiesterase